MSVRDNIVRGVYSDSIRGHFGDGAIILSVLLVGAGEFDVALVLAIVSVALAIRAGRVDP